jgi:rhodanese-related sulfurtransferase
VLIAPEIKIVTYCGGLNCEQSVDVARELKVIGYPNTYIFFNGYDKWLELNLPRESSDEK